MFFSVAIVSPSDPVYVAAKKMREFRVNSVVIVMGSKIQGILTYNFLYRLLVINTYTATHTDLYILYRCIFGVI